MYGRSRTLFWLKLLIFGTSHLNNTFCLIYYNIVLTNFIYSTKLSKFYNTLCHLNCIPPPPPPKKKIRMKWISLFFVSNLYYIEFIWKIQISYEYRFLLASMDLLQTIRLFLIPISACFEQSCWFAWPS